jgi:hypothetical protein
LEGKHVGKMPMLLELLCRDGRLVFGEFGGVEEAVFTREHFHESAELGDGSYLAHVKLFEHTADYQRDDAIEDLLVWKRISPADPRLADDC